MDDGGNWTAWGVAGCAVALAFVSLMISAGSCAGNDRNEAKIDHLEQRIDNIQFGRPK